MTDSGFELLMWARGPGLQIATAVFVGGIVLRIAEIWLLGRKHDFAPAKGDPHVQGIRTVFTRTLPTPGLVQQAPITFVGGYVFHLGFFIALFFFAPHIALFKDAFGLSWPALSRGIIEISTLLAIIAMIALLVTRLANPVRRMLSTVEDYLSWLLTILPLITGYMAVNHLLEPYNLALAVHILSVEALMIAFPFTKLMHGVTIGISRYYNGAIQGRKGAQS